MARPLWNDPEELEQRLRTVEPAVRLVPERHVRKILHHLHDAGDDRVINPELPVWVDARTVRAVGIHDERRAGGEEGDLLLISRPADRRVKRADDAVVLAHYWRLLVRAAVYREVSTQVADGRLAPGEIERRLAAFPLVFRHELRFVLESDHVIRHGAPDIDVYTTFVACFTDLTVFDPDRVPEVFPSALPTEAVLGIIGDGVDYHRFADRLRPTGAGLVRPAADAAGAPADEQPSRTQDATDPAAELSECDRAARLGNYTRAAVRRLRAARVAAGGERRRLEQAARSAVRNGLVKGLARSLGFDDAKADEWADALWPLVRAAAEHGVWPPAAKALYDLQKLAADIRGRVFAVAPVEWLMSFGRQPLSRPLDRTRDVTVLTRLARVEQHVLRAAVSDADRARVLKLLHAEMGSAEDRVRRNLSPVIRGVLDRVGLVPGNLPERVARDKLVGELLDRVCDRGFLRLSDLRDIIARNQLKLADLAGAGEFFRGDPLLRADRELAHELFGVYHRGEIYLRWIQRVSSLFFGTPVGRAVTLYLLIPFGGAFLTLMFAEEVRHLGGKGAAFVSKILAPRRPTVPAAPQPPADPPPAEIVTDEEDGETFQFDPQEASQIVTGAVSSSATVGAHHRTWLSEWPTVAALGVFILLLVHVPPFRRLVFAAAREAWGIIRRVFWDLPVAVLASPVVRTLSRSRVVRLAIHYLGWPFAATVFVTVLMAALGATQNRTARWGVAVFALTAVVTNSPLGRRLADRLGERIADAWRTFRVDLLPGLIAWIGRLFRDFLGRLDRILYAVDELLRYREGASRTSVTLKAALALVWFPVAYVTRFAFYLIVEPQVNPVKHFPVVTVSHKVIAPLFPTVARTLNIAEGTAILLLACVPGVFGFIAWELLANWRLYAANRPRALTPVPIGHHGETGRGLLRPGFHSGTVPKLFRKIRAGWLDAPAGADRHTRAHLDLHHIETAVRRQCEREVFRLWAMARPTAALAPAVTAVRLGCQTIALRMTLRPGDPQAIGVTVANWPDGLSGAVDWPWADAVGAEERGAVERALDGLLVKLATRPPAELTWEDWVAYWSKREAGPEPGPAPVTPTPS